MGLRPRQRARLRQIAAGVVKAAQPPQNRSALTVKLKMLVGGDGALIGGEARRQIGQCGGVMDGCRAEIAAFGCQIAAPVQPAPVRRLRRQKRIRLIELPRPDEQADLPFQGAAAKRLIGGGVERALDGVDCGGQVAVCRMSDRALNLIAGADLIESIQFCQRGGRLIQAQQDACPQPPRLIALGERQACQQRVIQQGERGIQIAAKDQRLRLAQTFKTDGVRLLPAARREMRCLPLDC